MRHSPIKLRVVIVNLLPIYETCNLAAYRLVKVVARPALLEAHVDLQAWAVSVCCIWKDITLGGRHRDPA